MIGRLLTAFISSLNNQAYGKEIQTVENRLIDTYQDGLYTDCEYELSFMYKVNNGIVPS